MRACVRVRLVHGVVSGGGVLEPRARALRAQRHQRAELQLQHLPRLSRASESILVEETKLLIPFLKLFH